MRGHDVLEIAARHLGEPYRFGARAELDNGDYQGPWDCAEFVTWCVRQAYGVTYGTTRYPGSDGPDPWTQAWYNQGHRDGALIDIFKAVNTPGAVLIRKPGSNLSGHVAFSDGAGGTIEAYSTRRGVIRHLALAPGRFWHAGCLVPGVDYDGEGRTG